MYSGHVEKLDELIKTAQGVKIKAYEMGADWLVRAAEEQIIWSQREKQKYLKKMEEDI